MDTWIILLLVLLVALSVAGLGLMIVALHKTRQIHLSTFQLVRDSEGTRREAEQLFGQLHALYALEKRLGLPTALPPMRGWAGSPDFFCTLVETLLEGKPRVVVECSSGVSTLVAARCMQMNSVGHVFSLEHDPSYAKKTRQMLEQYGVAEHASVLDAPLVSHNGDVPWYDDGVLPSNLDGIDVLVVDGPPQDTARLARLPALPRLLPRMAKNVVVILDDAAREAEREIVEEWLQMAPEFEVTYLPHEKGCAVLKREREAT